jgi:hypothetical protein
MQSRPVVATGLFTIVNSSSGRVREPNNVSCFSRLRRFFGRLWRDKSTQPHYHLEAGWGLFLMRSDVKKVPTYP